MTKRERNCKVRCRMCRLRYTFGGFHDGGGSDCGHLDYDTVWSCRPILTFGGVILWA
jgi:hypothetical protein